MINKTAALPISADPNSVSRFAVETQPRNSSFDKRVEQKRKRYAIEVLPNDSILAGEGRYEFGGNLPSPRPLEPPNIPPGTLPDLPRPGEEKPISPSYPPSIHPDTEPTTSPPNRLRHWH
jgi:hypothetical protein